MRIMEISVLGCGRGFGSEKGGLQTRQPLAGRLEHDGLRHRFAHGEDVLSKEEAVGFASLLLLAGSETTTNLIGNAVWALFEYPDELARVIARCGVAVS